jgi:hypothetical protein
MEEMLNVIQANNEHQLRQYSQHYVPHHAFRHIDFGANKHGIYGATPNDILHGVKLGIMSYMLEVLFTQEMREVSCIMLNSALTETQPHMRQTASQSFGRMNFPNGLTSLTNVTAEEVVSIMFMTCILSATQQGQQAMLQTKHLCLERVQKIISTFEMCLCFLQWMTNFKGFREILQCSSASQQQPNEIQANQTLTKLKATNAIKKLIFKITSTFERSSSQNWNISKIHELMHLPTLMEQYGSPVNFDSSACEKLHKDIAKKPGRQSQKRHKTFTQQAAQRLSERQMISRAYNIIQNETNNNNTKVSADSNLNIQQLKKGSSFHIKCIPMVDDEGKTFIQTHVIGSGLLQHVHNLQDMLPKHLIKFILLQIDRKYLKSPFTIECRTEYMDNDENLFRCHFNYRSEGFWYDWAMVTFINSHTTTEGNVPAKLLCFLPNGIPGNSEYLVVCHPCQWRKEKVTHLIRRWTKHASVPSINKGIPYEMVSVKSLCRHCFVIPDLRTPGAVYEVLDKHLWSNKFKSTLT